MAISTKINKIILMNRNSFMSTIVMLGWKKEDTFQYSKTIRTVNVVIICRETNALVLDNVPSSNTSSEFISYDKLIGLIYQVKEDESK